MAKSRKAPAGFELRLQKISAGDVASRRKSSRNQRRAEINAERQTDFYHVFRLEGSSESYSNVILPLREYTTTNKRVSYLFRLPLVFILILIILLRQFNDFLQIFVIPLIAHGTTMGFKRALVVVYKQG